MSKSFAELFADGEIQVQEQRALKMGGEATGTVAHITKDAVFLSLEDNRQAFFEITEFGTNLPVVGSKVKGFVSDAEGSPIKLVRKFGRGEASIDHLHLAFAEKAPVEGKVTGVNKGGIEVDLGAGARGFCPMSMIDEYRVDKVDDYINRTLSFLITKIEGKNIVLSRRAILEKESVEKKATALARLSVGQILKGRVNSVREFGAFVDLDGVQGLLPARELSYERKRVEDVVKIGDVVEVQILRIEEKNGKTEISLSMKALMSDPWQAIEIVAPIGRVISGVVTRTTEFGAFVRLAEGVEGLVHISEFGARVKDAAEAAAVGSPINVRVNSVDASKHRVSLSLASDGAQVGSEDRAAAVVHGSIVKATIEKIETFGVIAQIQGTKGRNGRGVIPTMETNTKPGTDLRKAFPIGQEVTVKIIEKSDSRLRLSIKAALDDAERADFDSFKSAQKQSGKMGTFADLLKGKI